MLNGQMMLKFKRFLAGLEAGWRQSNREMFH